MNAKERELIERWLRENPEEAKGITRCGDCTRPFIEDETAFYVSVLASGFRDKDTEKKLVCDECYNRYYSWNHLITKVRIE